MYSDLKTLLDYTTKRIEEENRKKNITSVMVFQEEFEENSCFYDNLRLLRNFSSSIFLMVSPQKKKKKEELEKLANLHNFKIFYKSTENNAETRNFSELMKIVLEEVIVMVPSNYQLTANLLEKLIADKAPLTTFIAANGNMVMPFFKYNKWVNKYLLSLLLVNERTLYDDFFRFLIGTSFCSLSKGESLVPIEDKKFEQIKENETTNYICDEHHLIIDHQKLIFMVSVVQILKDELSKTDLITSTFKIQKLMVQSTKLSETSHYFLAFMIVNFLVKNSEKITKLPLPWTINRLKAYAREVLFNEAKMLMNKNLLRLAYRAFEDIIEYELYEERELKEIRKQMEKLSDKLDKGNIICDVKQKNRNET